MKPTKLAAAFFFLGVNVAAAQQVIDLATPTPTPKAAPLASVAPTVAAPTAPVPAPTAAPEIVLPAATTPPAVAARQISGTPAPSKAPASVATTQAAAKPTPPPAPKEYSGRIRVTFCNDTTALGLDLATNMTVIVEPRFQGAHPGMVADLVGNRVIRQTRTTVTVACRSGAEDRTPYHNTPDAARAVGTALGVLKTLSGH